MCPGDGALLSDLGVVKQQTDTIRAMSQIVPVLAKHYAKHHRQIGPGRCWRFFYLVSCDN